MSCSACQLLRRNLSSIHIIFNTYRNRQILICFTLIINILAVCIPGKIITFLSKGLIALHIFNICQV